MPHRIVITSLLISIFASNVKAINIDDAIVMALNNYQAPLIDIERRRLEDNKIEAKKWQVSVRPILSLTHDGDDISAERFGINASVDMNSAGSLYAGTSRQNLPISNQTIRQQHIEYALPLFKRPILNDLNNPLAIDKELQRLERKLIRSQQKLVLEVVELFGQAAAAEIKYRDSVTQLEIMETRFKAANRSESERVRRLSVSQLELEEQRFQTESLELTAQELRNQLTTLLKSPLEEEELNIPPTRVMTKSLDELTRIALEHRLDYADALDQIDHANQVARLNRRYNIPEVTLRLGYSTSQYDDENNNDRFNFGLSGGDILGDSTNTKHNMYKLERARIERNVLEQQVRNDVVNAYLSLNKLRRILDLKKRQSEHYEKQLKGFQKLHLLGRTPYSEVELMQAKFYESRQSYILAQQEKTIATYRLKAALGTLIESPTYLLPAISNIEGANK